ncbi:MAG TPA: TolC family protein, partial [Anaeromyxobacteraceae bacterium]|nr:TolC family protein [Anaeromyxobacteraceae bacterium]
MRRLLALALALAACPAAALDDPALATAVREALDRSPEVARIRAEVAAESQRAPQVGAFPDPTLTLGIQNDSFNQINIGVMETSFWQVMVTQPIPWPGKRDARAAAAQAQATAAGARLGRAQLDVEAAVTSAWVELLLVRGQLTLLGKLEALWREAEALVRARYGIGAVPQSDLVRAQLELTRLATQRLGLEASARARTQELNRWRGHPLDEPVEMARPLAEADLPDLPTPERAVADAEERSPDLAAARLAEAAAGRRVEVAQRDRYPDLAVGAAVMFRGSLDPMWAATVSVGLPVFSKRGAAVTETTERRKAESEGVEAVARVVRLRAAERQTALSSVLATLKLYREGLLVQSDAAVRATMAQYRVGKVPFASVLESVRGLVADEGGFLDTQAQAQRVAIAARAVSLDPAGGLAAGLGGGGIP